MSAPGPSGPAARSDLLYGYYGGCVTDVVEQSRSINLWWATGFCGGTGVWWMDMAAELSAARAAGATSVMLALYPNMVFGPQAAQEAAFQFSRLAGTGQLAGWRTIAIYPQDEPDRAGKTDQEMVAAVAVVRAALAPIPALAAAPIAVSYACSTGLTPGIGAFDWVACDDYGSGCAALVELNAYPLKAGQRKFVLPGGADPWRQDPSCFIAAAEADPKIVAVVPFIWQTADGHVGIRENGMRATYCRAGVSVVTPGTDPASICP